MIFFDAEEYGQTKKAGKKQRKLSIVSWYDEELDEMQTAEEQDLPLFIGAAKDTDVIVGFNVFAFDYTLFEYTDYPVIDAKEKTLDFFNYLKNKLTGGDFTEKPHGLSLDALSVVNLGERKIQLTATPSDLWKAGEHEIVIAYNRQDVALLRKLYWKAIDEGDLFYDPYTINVEDMDEGAGDAIDCSDLEELTTAIQIHFYDHLTGW